MKIEKTSEEIVRMRKTTSTLFTLTNKKGESKEIEIQNYYQDDDLAGYESEETITVINDKVPNEDITDTFDDWALEFDPEEDPDTLIDNLREQITI
jgi:FKBP-type peptidyl-prolyl cis-trans isomerase (trigger factor)